MLLLFVGVEAIRHAESLSCAGVRGRRGELISIVHPSALQVNPLDSGASRWLTRKRFRAHLVSPSEDFRKKGTRNARATRGLIAAPWTPASLSLCSVEAAGRMRSDALLAADTAEMALSAFGLGICQEPAIRGRACVDDACGYPAGLWRGNDELANILGWDRVACTRRVHCVRRFQGCQIGARATSAFRNRSNNDN
jgi:hypothetical protein